MTIQVSSKDVNNLARYVTGAAINEGGVGLGEGMASWVIFDGVQRGGSYLWQNRKNFKTNGFKNTVMADAKAQQAFAQSMKGKNILQTTKNFWNYNKVAAAGGKTATTSALATTSSTGAATAATKGTVTASSLKTGSEMLKVAKNTIKGNGIFAAFSLIAATPEIIETYSTLGTASGNIQLGRTLVNVAAETAGFAVGMKAGAAVGAAVGSCIPVPILGTAVGAIVGAGIGFLGSWLAGKASKAIFGESEIKNKQEYNANVLTLRAKFTKDGERELLLAANEQLQQEGEEKSQAAIEAQASLNRILESYA